MNRAEALAVFRTVAALPRWAQMRLIASAMEVAAGAPPEAALAAYVKPPRGAGGRFSYVSEFVPPPFRKPEPPPVPSLMEAVGAFWRGLDVVGEAMEAGAPFYPPRKRKPKVEPKD